jgi:two-component system, NtrC family, nitrogen regulation sensor histidine kinase NtrY
MLFQKQYRVQIILRVLLIVGTSLLLAYFIGWTRYYEVWVIVAILIFGQISALVRYGEKTARDVNRFLESIRASDFSVGFTGRERGLIFERLRDSFEDVTEAFRRIRAEREERSRYLEHVVQNVRVALIAFRKNGDVEFMNPSAKRILSVSHIKTVHELTDRSETLVQTLLSLRMGDQALVRLEFEGRLLNLQISATQFRLGEDIYVLASMHDIGDELEEREMEAWQRLTRVLTHEIMNSVAPIASLASTADGLLHKVAKSDNAAETLLEDVREAMRVIERRSRALMHFIDTYRCFSQIPAPSFEMFSAAELLTRVRRLLSTRIADGLVECQIIVDPQDLMLIADPELIEQVLINLVFNALDAVDGRDEARIILRAHTDERGIPIVQVCDNGPGIPLDVQEHIFVPFFTTKEHGSGIGLSLSRQIMRLHGGTVHFQSIPNVETVFSIRF